MIIRDGSKSYPIDLNRGSLPFRFAEPAERESNLVVPKRAHLIWIGSNIPPKYIATIAKLKEHNRDYEFHFWSDRPLSEFDIHIANFQTIVIPRRTDQLFFANKDLIDAEENLGAKADLMRYEIVHQFGGVYLDVDHDSLGEGSLHPDMRFSFVQCSGDPWFNTTNSDFGFAEGSEFLEYVILNARDPRVRANTGDVPSRTGPTFFTTCVVSFGDERIVHKNGGELLKLLHHRGDANWVKRDG